MNKIVYMQFNVFDDSMIKFEYRIFKYLDGFKLNNIMGLVMWILKNINVLEIR